MAQDDNQERTEEPTPKRLREARNKGQIIRSRELNTFLIMMVASGGLILLGEEMTNQLLEIFRDSMVISRAEIFNVDTLWRSFVASIENALWMLVPFFALLMLVAFFAPMSLGGWTFSPEAMSFKVEKLNPIKGLSKVFGWKSLMELMKALGKFALVGIVAVFLLDYYAEAFLGLTYEPLRQALAHLGWIYSWSLLALSFSLIVVASIDVPFQIWEHTRQLKMTRQEVRDEMKETEGKPEVKGKIRSLQREIAQRRMMQEVPKADVVITNPTHYAVALRYKDGKMRAPLVLAKGTDLVAGQIRSIAMAHGIFVFEAPPLARGIYYSTELNKEVPAALYLAVAQVLAYVFQLRAYKKRGGSKPKRPVDLPVPPELYEGRAGVRS